MRAAYLTLVLALACFWSLGQNYVDIARVEFDYGIPQSFEDTNGIGAFNELAIDILAPIVINDKLAILTGALLEATQTSLQPGDSRIFYGTMLKIGVNVKHTEKWSGTYLLLPKLSSDLKTVGRQDAQIGCLAFIKYSPASNFNYRFGFYANSDLYAPMVVPIFGIYLLRNKWEISSALPINFQVAYQLHSKVNVGLRFDGINKSYVINDGSNTYMEKVNNELGGILRYAFGNIHLQLFGGYAIGRSFRTYAVGDRFDFALSAIKFNNQRTILNNDFGDGPVLRGSLTFRLPTNQE